MTKQKDKPIIKERVATTPEYELGERVRILAGHRAWEQCHAAVDELRYCEDRHRLAELPLSCLDELDLDTLAKLDYVGITTIGAVLARQQADVDWWRLVPGMTIRHAQTLGRAIEAEGSRGG